MMNRLLPLGLLLAVTAVSACETMQGAGRDMQSAGQLLTQQSANSQAQMGAAPYGAAPMQPTAPAPY